MSQRSTQLLRAALSAMHYSGACSVAAPFTRGMGVIFMLHHVRPEQPQPFEPNRILAVTPDFLDDVVEDVLDAGFDVVALDDVPARLAAPTDRPFACFTFDDGYRDNREHAYPIFKRRNLPFAIYVPTAYPDGEGMLWWLELEQAIRGAERVSCIIDSVETVLPTRTVAEKEAAFQRIYWSLRGMPERRARALVADFTRNAGCDTRNLCRDLVMTWDDIRALAKDPLVTIGAHTRNHYAVAKLPADEVRAEILESVKRIERELGRPCLHFSYPYGDETSAGVRDFAIAEALGLKTAVTTRRGLLHGPHAGALMALPRLSLNGDYQQRHYVRALLSGAPFALYDAVSRVRAVGSY